MSRHTTSRSFTGAWEKRTRHSHGSIALTTSVRTSWRFTSQPTRVWTTSTPNLALRNSSGALGYLREVTTWSLPPVPFTDIFLAAQGRYDRLSERQTRRLSYDPRMRFLSPMQRAS